MKEFSEFQKVVGKNLLKKMHHAGKKMESKKQNSMYIERTTKLAAHTQTAILVRVKNSSSSNSRKQRQVRDLKTTERFNIALVEKREHMTNLMPCLFYFVCSSSQTLLILG